MTLGGVFYTKLQIRGTPNIAPPIISINAQYSGADALYMEKQITTRMEKELKTLKNLDFMSSESKVGQSNITLSFKLDTDIEIALNDVRSKISDLKNYNETVFGNKNIVRLNVAVDKLGLAPAVFEAGANMRADRDRLRWVQLPKPLEARINALPVHKFHREPVDTIGLSSSVDLHQIRVI
jgi:hypothetical protein